MDSVRNKTASSGAGQEVAVREEDATAKQPGRLFLIDSKCTDLFMAPPRVMPNWMSRTHDSSQKGHLYLFR